MKKRVWKGKRKHGHIYIPTAKPSVAKQALNLAKSNKRKIGETADVTQTAFVRAHGSAMNATPVVVFLYPTGGEGYSIKLKNYYIDFMIRDNVTSVLMDDWRVDIVLDMLPDGSNLTPLKYLGHATPTITHRKIIGGQSRFKILRSFAGCVNKTSGNGFFHFNGKVPVNRMMVSNTGGDFAIAKITKNALFLVYWTTASANQPTIGYHSYLTNVTEG